MLETEVKYPSVTEILSATMPEDKRATLEAWRLRVGEQEAERIREVAFARGRAIDDQVAAIQAGEQVKDQRIVNYLTGYRIVEREMRVRSEANKYRGRLDAILEINSRMILVDFKGSNRWKPKKQLDDYRLQLGAYFGACIEMGLTIDAACVTLFVDGREKPQVYWQQPEELRDAHCDFVLRVKQYELQLLNASLTPQ
jgi:hypothetical protein